MPGPGGGSHSGGGGSRGGGFGGGGRPGGPGGFHGGPHGPHGPHRPPRRHYHGFWFGPRPYYYGYGGGFFGGFFAFMLLPIIMLLIAAIVLFAAVGSAFSTVANGGQVEYDESTFQAFAGNQYDAIYGTSEDAYLDDIVIVFLTYEDHYEYNYIAWCGDHINENVRDLFGNNGTALGAAMNSSISETSYEYSLSMNLASVISRMETRVASLGNTSSFISGCHDTRANSPVKLVNKSALSMTEETVMSALTSFTATTGIPISVVIEDAEDVFGRTTPAGAIVTVIVCLAIAGVAIYLIVRGVKNRRGGNGGNNGNGYNNGGNNGYNNNYNNNSSSFHNMYDS